MKFACANVGYIFALGRHGAPGFRVSCLKATSLLIVGVLGLTTPARAQSSLNRTSISYSRYEIGHLYVEGGKAKKKSKGEQGKKSSDIGNFVKSVDKADKNNSKGSGAPVARPPRSSSVAIVPPKDQTAPPLAAGKLVVLTDVPDAAVIIKSNAGIVEQGRSQGGRFQADLPPGDYKIEVESANHTGFAGNVIINPGATETVKAKLLRMGAIIIDLGTVSPDVTILIDGQPPAAVKKLDANRIEIENIPRGAHTIRYSHLSIKDFEEKFEILGGDRLQLNPQLEQVWTKLIIKTEPGADIYLDDTYECKVLEDGRSPAVNMMPGMHTIRVVKRGFTTVEMTRVFKVDEREIEIKLTKPK